VNESSVAPLLCQRALQQVTNVPVLPLSRCIYGAGARGTNRCKFFRSKVPYSYDVVSKKDNVYVQSKRVCGGRGDIVLNVEAAAAAKMVYVHSRMRVAGCWGLVNTCQSRQSVPKRCRSVRVFLVPTTDCSSCHDVDMLVTM
jgi:hypothetical protein